MKRRKRICVIVAEIDDLYQQKAIPGIIEQCFKYDYDCYINVDKENPILQRCKVLKEYSGFIEQVRFNIENNIPEPFTTAIKQSSRNGFLANYLQRKSTEVQNMLLMEYDYATDIEVQREEAFEKGVSQGEYQAKIQTAKKFLTMGLSLEQISQGTGLSIDEIKNLQ